MILLTRKKAYKRGRFNPGFQDILVSRGSFLPYRAFVRMIYTLPLEGGCCNNSPLLEREGMKHFFPYFDFFAFHTTLPVYVLKTF